MFDQGSLFSAQRKLEGQWNSTPDMYLNLDLYFGQSRGRSYIICFDGAPKFDNDHQEEKYEFDHFAGLLKAHGGNDEDTIKENFPDPILNKDLISY